MSNFRPIDKLLKNFSTPGEVVAYVTLLRIVLAAVFVLFVFIYFYLENNDFPILYKIISLIVVFASFGASFLLSFFGSFLYILKKYFK